MSPRRLYPPLNPYRIDYLKVDDIHTLYVEQSGNPDGVPVVFLHGGPGGGSSPGHRRFFDPKRYRIVIFDQRGCGKSTPHAETRRNTTAHLIEDMEKIRQMLGIERWHLFGGSWGATLALAYAQAHPTRCLGLILRGIFLMRPAEVHWFLYGMRMIFPEAWHAFAGFIPEGERNDLLAAYTKRLNNPATQLAAARAWSRYEGACSSLISNPNMVAAYDDPKIALPLARLEAHYMATDIHDGARDLMRHIDRICHIPCAIVQGRYDIICPIKTADELHRAWPEAEYTVIPDGGHSAIEPGLRTALLEATERFEVVRD